MPTEKGWSRHKKPFDQLTESGKKARLARERKKAEQAEQVVKLPPRKVGDSVEIPDTPDAVERATAEQRLRELVLKNDRTEGVTVSLLDAEQQYTKLLDTFKAGLHLFPDKFPLLRPGATEDDIQALKKLGDEVVSMIKGAAYDKG